MIIYLDGTKRRKIDIKERLSAITGIQAEGEENKAEMFDQLLQIEKDIMVVQAHIKEAEASFSQQFIEFISYKDNADLIDNFEKALAILLKEKPLIVKSMVKLTENFEHFSVLIADVLCDNLNYEQNFHKR